MSNVIELKFKKKPTKDVLFDAYCEQCDFRWVALTNENANTCKCPMCKAETVDMSELDSDEAHWICECGFDVFHVSNRRITCARCGDEQASFYEFD